jgi:hypothetical protein
MFAAFSFILAVDLNNLEVNCFKIEAPGFIFEVILYKFEAFYFNFEANYFKVVAPGFIFEVNLYKFEAFYFKFEANYFKVVAPSFNFVIDFNSFERFFCLSPFPGKLFSNVDT